MCIPNWIVMLASIDISKFWHAGNIFSLVDCRSHRVAPIILLISHPRHHWIGWLLVYKSILSCSFGPPYCQPNLFNPFSSRRPILILIVRQHWWPHPATHVDANKLSLRWLVVEFNIFGGSQLFRYDHWCGVFSSWTSWSKFDLIVDNQTLASSNIGVLWSQFLFRFPNFC